MVVWKQGGGFIQKGGRGRGGQLSECPSIELAGLGTGNARQWMQVEVTLFISGPGPRLEIEGGHRKGT